MLDQRRQAKRGRDRPARWLEGLECRVLLSVTPAIPAAELNGTFAGDLTATSGSAAVGVPYRQQISLTLSPGQSPGELTGSVAVQSMGNFSVDAAGTANRHFTAVFGDNNSGAGVITGMTMAGGAITGSFRDVIGGKSLIGNFRVTPAASAISTTPMASSSAGSSSSSNESVLSGFAQLAGAGYLGFQVPATLDITGGTSGGLVTGTFTIQNNTFDISGISSARTLTFALTGAGAGYGSGALNANGNVLSGRIVATVPNGLAKGSFAMFSPASSSSSGSTSGTSGSTLATNYPVSTLFGSVGGFASPVGAVTNPGSTGTFGQPGTSPSTLPPSSATGSLLPGTGTGSSVLGGTGASSPSSGNVVDSFNPIPNPANETGTSYGASNLLGSTPGEPFAPGVMSM